MSRRRRRVLRREPSRARIGAICTDPLAKDGVTYPGAKRPGRSRGVKIDAKRNQSS